MATGTIKKVFSSGYVSASSVTTEQLKNANVVIARYQADSTTVSTVALLPNEYTKGLSAVWNGQRWFYTMVSILWSKTNGTVTLSDSYTERPNATPSILGYFLIF